MDTHAGARAITAATHLKARAEAPGVLASSATGVVSWIERFKGDVDRIFGHAGIAPEMAGAPTLVLDLDCFCRLFEESARQTHNDNFGLSFGIDFDPRDLGLWGYAAISAPTLGVALDTLVELFPLHQQSSVMQLVPTSAELVRLEYRIETAEICERRQDAELTLGQVTNLIRGCLGRGWAPEEVHFEHPKPAAWREHERSFGAPVFFAQPTNALIIRRRSLSAPMPTSDLRLMAHMRHCLERLSERKDLRASVIDRVRAAARARLPDGAPHIEAIAGELRVPVGVIQRELSYEGTTFGGLIEAMRRDLAMSYLGQRQLSLSEIAFLLGYSELSAFSRAVRRWTGTPPRQVRSALLAGRRDA